MSVSCCNFSCDEGELSLWGFSVTSSSVLFPLSLTSVFHRVFYCFYLMHTINNLQCNLSCDDWLYKPCVVRVPVIILPRDGWSYQQYLECQYSFIMWWLILPRLVIYFCIFVHGWSYKSSASVGLTQVRPNKTKSRQFKIYDLASIWVGKFWEGKSWQPGKIKARIGDVMHKVLIEGQDLTWCIGTKQAP